MQKTESYIISAQIAPKKHAQTKTLYYTGVDSKFHNPLFCSNKDKAKVFMNENDAEMTSLCFGQTVQSSRVITV